MVDRRKKMHRAIVDSPPDYMKNLLQTSIPYDSNVERMGTKRTPLAEYAPNSRSARCYEALWEDIKQQLSLID
jgi:cellulose biosynthesis protein BcsQ